MPHRRIAGLTLLAIVAGCVTPPAPVPEPLPPLPDVELEPLPEDVSFEPARGGPPPLLSIALPRPLGTHAAEQSRLQLDAYLTKELGGEVVTRIFLTPNALVDAIANGTVEAAWMTPILYVRASKRRALVPHLMFTRAGSPNYRTAFFTRSDGKAPKLADMKGKRLALVASGSTSGRLYPLHHLRQLKIAPERFFSKILDLPDHREVCRAVLDGRADVGVTYSDEVRDPAKAKPDGCSEAGVDIRKLVLLERSEPIPNDVIVFRADVPEAVRDRVRAALLALTTTEAGLKQLETIFRADGFVNTSDADFARVRELEAGPPK